MPVFVTDEYQWPDKEEDKANGVVGEGAYSAVPGTYSGALPVIICGPACEHLWPCL